MIQIQCDRCEKHAVNGPATAAAWTVQIGRTTLTGSFFHLCDDCRVALKQWIKNGVARARKMPL